MVVITTKPSGSSSQPGRSTKTLKSVQFLPFVPRDQLDSLPNIFIVRSRTNRNNDEDIAALMRHCVDVVDVRIIDE